MNRSILIVICDFLLVSLLVFSRQDINQVTDTSAPRTLKLEIATNQPDSGRDLAAAMRLALAEERQHRDLLQGELSQTRSELGEREQQVQTFQQELQSRQQQLQSREQQLTQLHQAQTNLQEQLGAARTNLQTLDQQLQSRSTEALITKEQLAAMQADARQQAERAAALQKQLDQLASSNQVVLAEKQRLSTQLQVANAEKRAATEQVGRMTEEVRTERAEKAKLVEGFQAMATNSGKLAQEIRENRPLAPNTIFSDFVTNRVQARLDAVRSGLFGDATRTKDAETVLVSDGTNIFALCHVQDTPLALWNPGTDWEQLSGTLSRGATSVAVRSLSFCWTDPRVVWMPVTAAEARQLGCAVYRTSPDPYKFQDAVLIGAQEGYYGECRFQIDLTTPQYVKLDRSFLKGLFGKFNPSRGDLVFSRNGELLGIMANNTYCLMLGKFDATATFKFGADTRAEHTGSTLSQLYSQVAQLPPKLQ
jgi:hypothetical protein